MANGQCQAVALLEVGTSSATTRLLPVWDQRLLLAAPLPARWGESRPPLGLQIILATD